VSVNPRPAPLDSAKLPPSGTVTFVFTDIEGSTQRWDRDGRNTARLIGNVELKF
jgi:class 3 adenylate cyclase